MPALLDPLERAILELLLDTDYGYGQLPYNSGREELRQRGLDVGAAGEHSLESPYCQAVLSLHARGFLDLSQVIVGAQQRPLHAVAPGGHVNHIGGPFRVFPERYSEVQRLLGIASAPLGPRQRLSALAA